MPFNTAIAAMIELNNELVKRDQPITVEIARSFVLILSPMAPHIAEELWRRLGAENSLARDAWPAFDPALLVEDQVEYAVQVNGKLRGRVTVPADADEKAIESAALADVNVKSHTDGKQVRKVIVVKGRMVNIVVG